MMMIIFITILILLLMILIQHICIYIYIYIHIHIHMLYIYIYIYAYMCFFTHRITVFVVLCATLWRSAGFAVHSCRGLVVAFGRPGVRLPEKPTSGLQYSCSDQEFRLVVLNTAAPIDREEKIYVTSPKCWRPWPAAVVTDGVGTPDPNPRNLVNWCP